MSDRDLALGGRARTLLRSPLVAGGAGGLFAAVMVMNVGNFAFHMLETRNLGPSSYGALGSLIGLLTLFQVPLGALEIAFTKSIASSGSHAARNARAMTRRAIVAGAAVAGLMVAASPLLVRFLHLPNAIPVVAAALVVFPTIVALVPKSLLLGTMRFGSVAKGIALSSVMRLLVAFGTAALGGGVVAAMLAIAVGETVALIAYTVAARAPAYAPQATFKAGDALLPSLAFTGFYLLAGLDTLLARHYLPAADAGYYAAAANAAKAVLFLPGAVALAAFPRFADRGTPVEERQRVLRHALVVVTVMVGGAASAVALLPGLFVGILFGSAYAASSSLVGMLAIVGAALGITQLLVYFLLARGSRLSLLPWATAAVMTGLVVWRHGSTMGLARTAFATVGFGLLTFLWLTLRRPPPLGDMSFTPAQIDVSIVVPAFNPGVRLRPTVVGLLAVLRDEGCTSEVIVVSDGSTDESIASLDGLAAASLVVVEHSRNRGKGEALRTGFGRSQGRYVGFLDADGDIAPSTLRSFLALARLYEPDVILGSKRHPLSEVQYPPLRRFYSTIFQIMTRVLFRLNVRDTQTGVKLVHRSVLEAVLPRMGERGYCFDLELFVVARQLGFKRFLEAPVRIEVRFSSTISLRSVIRMFRDVWRIFWRHRIDMPFEGIVQPVVVADPPQPTPVAASLRS